MSTLTATTAHAIDAENTAPFTLAGFLAALFMVDLRDSLAADTKADASDAAYTWGM